MTQIVCSYPDREAVLVAYLYDDMEAAERVAFETHVMACEPCRAEVADMRGVRSTLAQWAPPLPVRVLSFLPRAARREPQRWWHTVPVWAQVAAAMLVFGASLSLANLDVRYDRANGLSVRTGWSKPAPAAASAPATVIPVAELQQADVALRAEIEDLRAQLQSAVRSQPATVKASFTPAISETEFEQRVREAIDVHAKKQDQDLAVHLVQLQRDVDAQRQADIRRTNQLFRDVMSTYGTQIANQQRQINYLLPASEK